MTKTEFLEKLRLALNGKVTYTVVNENIQYYDDYISMQVKKGESEEAVTDALGDPRLIAKTIIETSSSAERSGEYDSDGGVYEDGSAADKKGAAKIPGWLLIIMIILIAGVVMSVVGSVLTFLLPVLIPAVLILMVYSFFKRR